MAEGKVDMVLFGGSAGSLDVLLNVLPRIKKDIGFPLVLVIHRKYSDHLAGLVSRLHVDDAFATTRLQAVSRNRRLLAVALL